MAWCLTPVKALILRRGAPRHWSRPVLRRDGRGASLLAKPYSFVAGHHVIGAGRCYGGKDVVPHTCQSLDLSLRGTTSLVPAGSSMPSNQKSCSRCVISAAALLLFKNLNKQYPPVRTESVWMPGCRSCSVHPESDSLPPCPWTAVCGTAPEVQRR